MRFIQAQIIGFGKWQNQQIDFHHSITFISGPNESGKSTLRQFILYILFDLPTNLKQQYEPKSGGMLGGRLIAEHPDYGRIIVERMASRNQGSAICFLENGREEGEEFLKGLLNGLDRKTFEAIYSFGSRQLQDIVSINREELGDVLFGIGMTGSKKIHEIEKELDKSLNTLFKKQGKNPIINQQLQTTEAIYHSVLEAEKQEAHYGKIKKQIEDIKASIATIESKRDEKKYQIEQYEKRLQLLDVIQQYQLIQKKLEDFEDINDFPEDGLARFHQLKEKLLPIVSEEEVLKSTMHQQEEQLKRYQDKAVNPQLRESLEYFLEEKQRFELKKAEIQELETTIRTQETKLRMQMDELAITFSVEELSQLSLPVFVEDKWQQLNKELQQVQLERKHLLESKNTTTKQITLLTEEMQIKEQYLLPTTQLHALTEKVETAKELEVQLKLKDMQAYQQDKNVSLLSKAIKGRERLSKNVLWIGLISAVLLGYFGYREWNTLLYILSGLSIGIGIISNRLLHASCKRWKAAIAQEHQAEKTILKEQLPLEDIEQIKKKLEEHSKVQNEMDQINNKIKDLKMEQLRLLEKEEQILDRTERLDHQIEEQKMKYPFLYDIDVEYWPKMYHVLKNLQADANEVNILREKHQRMVETNRLFEEKLIAFFEEHFTNQYESVLSIWKSLMNKKSEDDLNRERLLEQEQWIMKTMEKRDSLNNSCKPYLQEIDKLMNYANTTSEETFIQKGKRLEEYQTLTKEADRHYYQVESLFPNEGSKVIQEVMDSYQIRKKLEQFDIDRKTIEEELDLLRQHLSDALNEQKRLEQSEQYSVLVHQFSQEKDILQKQAKEWATYQVAKQFLQKTKKKFQTERMPKIIEKTTEYFSMLTEGRYKKVIAPKGKQAFQVEDNLYIRYKVNELSEGTAHQLYVSLRFALSEVMSEHTKLPFIIDDAFVHFDKGRTEEIASLLRRIKDYHQVIIFSCHPELSTIFKSEKVINLIDLQEKRENNSRNGSELAQK